MDKFSKYDWGILAIILGYPLLLVVVSYFYRPLWDSFVWPYYVGPIVSDAGGNAGSLTSSYNKVDTTTYALILSGAVYLIYRSFTVWKFNMTSKYIAAMLPVIILGGLLRSLEDADLILRPLKYAVISPEIYIILGLSVYGLTVLAMRCRRRILLALVPVTTGALMDIIMHLGMTSYSFFTGSAAALGFLGSIGMYLYLARPKTDEGMENDAAYLIFYTFTPVLLYFTAYVFFWPNIPSWTAAHLAQTGGRVITTHPEAFLIMMAYFIPAMLLYIIPAYALKKKNDKYSPLLSISVVSMVFAHFWDASATTTGINHFGYMEKHVIPSWAIAQVGGNGAVMFLLKAIVLGLVIYYVEFKYREEMYSDRNIVGLIKVAFIVLGLAPGTRDILRIIMGV